MVTSHAMLRTGVVLAGVSVALTVKRLDEADALAALPRPKLERSFFGSVSIPEPSASAAYHDPGHGRRAGLRWEHEALGLTLDLPSGAQLADTPGTALTAAAPGVVLVGAYLDERLDEDRASEFLRGLTDGLAAAGTLAGAPATTTNSGWRSVTTNGADAKEATLRWGTSTVVARAYPMCGGRTVFYLVGISLSPASEEARKRWQDSLALTGPAPACNQ